MPGYALRVDFVWRQGVHVAGSGLWCDAPRAHDLCFLSSAQVFSAQGRAAFSRSAVLCSEQTWRLCQAVDKHATARSLLLSPPGRPFSLGNLRLELFPSGGMIGASSLWLRLPSGQTVIYAGAPNPAIDFSEAAGCEPLQVRAADTLVCHAPLAAVQTRLPPLIESRAALAQALASAKAESAVTVLLCPPLTMARVLCGLPEVQAEIAGKSLFAQTLVMQALHALHDEAAQHLRRPTRPLRGGSILLWPLTSTEPLPAISRLAHESAGGVRVYLCTGLGLVDEVAEACRASLLSSGLELSAVLPFPDVMDRDGLVRYVAATEARRVQLTTGFTDGLSSLMRRGRTRVEVAPLGPPRQLQLLA